MLHYLEITFDTIRSLFKMVTSLCQYISYLWPGAPFSNLINFDPGMDK